MSAEAIIKKIQTDADKEIALIQQKAKKQIDEMLKSYAKKTKELEQLIIENGKKECENIQRIHISQAHQEVKRQLMNIQEESIEHCFHKAKENLANLDEQSYVKIINILIDNGKKQIKGSFSIKTSKPLDKKIAKEKKIPVIGTIQASGGIVLIADKGNISIDNTFEGILKRRKQEIRVQVGKLLFS